MNLKVHFPSMSVGAHSPVVPPYFRHFLEIFKEAVDCEVVNVKKLEEAQAKIIYQEFTSTLPPPKIVFKFENLPFELIWKRLENPIINSEAKNILFKVFNNIIPNRDRLFKMQKVQHPFCLEDNCHVKKKIVGPLLPGKVREYLVIGGEVDNTTHLFTECVRTIQVWSWIRGRIMELLNPGLDQCSNFELLHLAYSQSKFENEIIFILSNYIEYVYKTVFIKERKIDVDKMKAILKYNYLENAASNKPVIAFVNFMP